MQLTGIILNFILNITCIAAIVIGIIKIKEPSLFLILTVLILSEIRNVSILFGYSSPLLLNLFIFTEFSAYIIYLGFMINKNQFIALITTSLLSLAFFLIDINPNYETFNIRSFFLIIIPPLLIILGCFLYLKNILLADDNSNFYNLPSFWIVLGFLNLFLIKVLCEASSFILFNNELLYRKLSGNIIQTFYIIFYLFSIKAFLCSKRNYR